ncbi:MAG: hypothetical protein ACXWP5_05340 [Bdellovibrionota bacterium]
MIKNQFKSIMTFVLAQFAAVALTAGSAFAIGGEMETLSAMKQEGIFTGRTKIKIVRVEGALSCERPMVNNGDGCVLNLRDTKSGRNFRLIEANDAQHLYSTGKKNVAVEGVMQDSETIEVKKADSL